MALRRLEEEFWNIQFKEENELIKRYLEGYFYHLLNPTVASLKNTNNLTSILVNLYVCRIFSDSVLINGEPIGEGGLTRYIRTFDPLEWKIIAKAKQLGGSLDELILNSPQLYYELNDDTRLDKSKFRKILTKDYTREEKPTRDTQGNVPIEIDASIYTNLGENALKKANEWRKSLRRDVFFKKKQGKTNFSFYYHMVPYFPFVTMLSPNLHKLHDQYIDRQDRQIMIDLFNLLQNDLGKNLSVGYNAIGSGASVRLLHFQVFLHQQGWNYEIEAKIDEIMKFYNTRSDKNEPIHVQFTEQKKYGGEVYQDSIWVPFGNSIVLATDYFMNYITEINRRAKTKDSPINDIRYNLYINQHGVMILPKKNQTNPDYRKALDGFGGSKGFSQSEYIGLIPLLGIGPKDATYENVIEVFKSMNFNDETLFIDEKKEPLNILKI